MAKPSKISDEDILAGMRGGTAERRRALQHFFSDPELMPWALRYVRMQGGNEQDGQDVFEEAFIVFERQLRTGHFRGESSLNTWFHSLVRWQWSQSPGLQAGRGYRGGKEAGFFSWWQMSCRKKWCCLNSADRQR